MWNDGSKPLDTSFCPDICGSVSTWRMPTRKQKHSLESTFLHHSFFSKLHSEHRWRMSLVCKLSFHLRILWYSRRRYSTVSTQFPSRPRRFQVASRSRSSNQPDRGIDLQKRTRSQICLFTYYWRAIRRRLRRPPLQFNRAPCFPVTSHAGEAMCSGWINQSLIMFLTRWNVQKAMVIRRVHFSFFAPCTVGFSDLHGINGAV